jgi:hypothetical protein
MKFNEAGPRIWFPLITATLLALMSVGGDRRAAIIVGAIVCGLAFEWFRGSHPRLAALKKRLGAHPISRYLGCLAIAGSLALSTAAISLVRQKGESDELASSCSQMVDASRRNFICETRKAKCDETQARLATAIRTFYNLFQSTIKAGTDITPAAWSCIKQNEISSDLEEAQEDISDAKGDISGLQSRVEDLEQRQ